MAQMTILQFELLAALAKQRRHGYALVNDLEDTMRKRPGIATVYSALEKLQATQWVTADGDEIVDGRVRRYFVLTDDGVKALTEEADELARRAAAAKKSIQSHSTRGALA